MGYRRIRVNHERVRYWLGVGAQPTATAARLLGQAGVLPAAPVRSKVPAWQLFPNGVNTKARAERAAERLKEVPEGGFSAARQ